MYMDQNRLPVYQIHFTVSQLMYILFTFFLLQSLILYYITFIEYLHIVYLNFWMCECVKLCIEKRFVRAVLMYIT